ncbi:MAG: UDP-N-acetylmuramoyl-L-alanine--D-glutamate ligase [Patescibacteria group bacterium]
MILDHLKASRSVHVVGISGSEGAAIALALAKQGIRFTAHDFSDQARFKRNFFANNFGIERKKREKMFKELEKFEDQIKFKNDYLKGISKADLIFVSQNWEAYEANDKLKPIFKKNPAKFAIITQLYFQLFPGKIIAITGTNGKSTTAKLISEIMQASRQKSWFTGNDRRNVQILDCLDKWTQDDWLVIEVSNRQLKFPLSQAPEIGVITNVTNNHLDEYGGSFRKYKAGKYSLIKNQDQSKIAILNQDNPATRQFSGQVKGTPLPYSTKQKLQKGVYIDGDWIVHRDKTSTKILPVGKICLLGEHNLSNVLAAIAAARLSGVDWPTIRKVVSRFRGIPQRLELIATKAGVNFINDTSSTSPDSAIAAISSFATGSIHLIAGGDPKGLDFAPLAREIKRRKVRVVILKSPVELILGRELRRLGIDFVSVKNLQEAVKISAKNAQRGESVLLSPGAAWFCHFRGKIPLGGRGFAQFVKSLA